MGNNMNEATYIFYHFFQTVIELAKKNKISADELASLLEDLKKQNLSLNVNLESKRYFNNVFSLRFSEISEHPYIDPSLLQKFTQKLYEDLCESIGPVVTDKIYGLAINKSNQLPEAMFFSPQDLLG